MHSYTCYKMGKSKFKLRKVTKNKIRILSHIFPFIKIEVNLIFLVRVLSIYLGNYTNNICVATLVVAKAIDHLAKQYCHKGHP